jgi:hypothetical protein
VRLERLNDGAPLLNAPRQLRPARRDRRRRRGHREDGRQEGHGHRSVREGRGRPRSRPGLPEGRDGIIQNISVGYRVNKFQKTDDVENKIPTYRAIDWEPFEISFVPVGADAGAGVRHQRTVVAEPCQFILPAASRGITDADRKRLLRLARARR